VRAHLAPFYSAIGRPSIAPGADDPDAADRLLHGRAPGARLASVPSPGPRPLSTSPRGRADPCRAWACPVAQRHRTTATRLRLTGRPGVETGGQALGRRMWRQPFGVYSSKGPLAITSTHEGAL
jgi:hypothetical protein